MLKRTHIHLLFFRKKTFLKRKSLDLVIKYLRPKTFLSRFWKIQSISTQKFTNIFNECLINGKFPDTLKRANVTPILEKRTVKKRKTIAQWVCSQTFQKCLKNYYLNKLMIICKVNSQSILQVFTKTTALKMRYWLWLKNGKLFWIKNSKWVLFLWIC